jgi:hypothetical protein
MVPVRLENPETSARYMSRRTRKCHHQRKKGIAYPKCHSTSWRNQRERNIPGVRSNRKLLPQERLNAGSEIHMVLTCSPTSYEFSCSVTPVKAFRQPPNISIVRNRRIDEPILVL